jgi:arginine N-succinyltransferase
MIVIRPVENRDLQRLFELANQANYGLTNLPKDKSLLKRRIEESIQSFGKKTVKPRGELYMFVLEDLETGSVEGTSCIISKIGGFEPFYTYRIESAVRESEVLHIRKEVQTLHLVQEHSGPSEIGGLYLNPDYRKKGVGRLLSLFRFLFMAEHPEKFEPAIIAEMRGVVDASGHSPFWDALGAKFFDLDYQEADLLSVMDKRFIADLMPEFPIYIPLLPEAAQRVIGQVHENTKPALNMLMEEGFMMSDMVDIFEAGPIIFCRLDQVRIIQESRSGIVKEVVQEPLDSMPYIIINTGRKFRATSGNVVQRNDGLMITESISDLLGVKPGQRIIFSSMRPSGKSR